MCVPELSRGRIIPHNQFEAERAFAWFSGGNELGFALADPVTGGCCDGLQENRVNLNQGAESTLAWLQSSAEMKLAEGMFSGEPPAAEPPDRRVRAVTAGA